MSTAFPATSHRRSPSATWWSCGAAPTAQDAIRHRTAIFSLVAGASMMTSSSGCRTHATCLRQAPLPPCEDTPCVSHFFETKAITARRGWARVSKTRFVLVRYDRLPFSTWSLTSFAAARSSQIPFISYLLLCLCQLLNAAMPTQEYWSFSLAAAMAMAPWVSLGGVACATHGDSTQDRPSRKILLALIYFTWTGQKVVWK